MKLTIDIDEAAAAKIARGFKSDVVYQDRPNQALQAVANAWREQRPVQMGERYRTSAGVTVKIGPTWEGSTAVKYGDDGEVLQYRTAELPRAGWERIES